MKKQRNTIILTKGSRTTFPKGSRCAFGEAKLHPESDTSNSSLKAGSMGLAFQVAIDNFIDEFGRRPHLGRLAFRGTFTEFQTYIEICELPEDKL